MAILFSMQEVDDAVAAADKTNRAWEQYLEPVSPDPDNLPAVDTSNVNLSTKFREPWDRLPDETDKAWLAFKHYRDQGQGRTIAETVRAGLGASNSIYKWVKKYEWHPRVAAFDIAEDRIYQLRRIEAVKEMAERHGNIIVEALEAMSAPFEALAIKFASNPDAMQDLSERDTIKLLDLASKMARNMPGLMSSERLARGMPTEIVDVQGEVKHSHDLGRDQIGEIVAALASANALPDGGSNGRGDRDDFEIFEAELVEVHSDGSAP